MDGKSFGFASSIKPLVVPKSTIKSEYTKEAINARNDKLDAEKDSGTQPTSSVAVGDSSSINPFELEDEALEVAEKGGPSKPAVSLLDSPKKEDQIVQSENGVLTLFSAKNAVVDQERDDFQVKREQFHYRISSLIHLLNTAEEKMLALASRRSSLKILLATFDKKAGQLNRDLWALTYVDATHIETSIFGGVITRALLSDVRIRLLQDIKSSDARIASIMRDVFHLDAQSRSFKKRYMETDTAIEERRRSLLAFEDKQQKLDKARGYGINVKRGMPYKCFMAWRSLSAVRRQKKLSVMRVISIVDNRPLSHAFREWRKWTGSEAARQLQTALKTRRMQAGGLGTILLVEAERLRGDGETDAMKMLGWLRSVENELNSTNADMAFRRVLKGVTTTGAGKNEGGFSLDSKGGEPLHRTLGLPLTATAPLTIHSTGGAPNLALVEGYIPVPALSTFSADMGTDILQSAKALQASGLRDHLGTNLFAHERQRMQLQLHGVEGLDKSTLGEDVFEWARGRLNAALAFYDLEAYDRAILAAKQAEQIFGFKKNADGLLAVYRLLARILEAMSKFDYGVIHWDRCVELARDPSVLDPLAEAEGLEGRGRCLTARAYHDEALRAFERAESIYDDRNDLPALARVFRLQSKVLFMLRFYEKSEALLGRATDIENRSSFLLSAGFERLAALELIVASAGVAESTRVQMELSGPALPLLYQQLLFVQSSLSYVQRDLAKVRQTFKRHMSMAELFRTEAEMAERSEAMMIESSIPTGAPVRYTTNQLRVELRQGQEMHARELNSDGKIVRELEAREKTFLEEAVNVRRWLGAEKRELAELVAARQPVGVVALNSANSTRRASDALGIHESGDPYLAIGSNSSIYTHSVLDGAVLNCFVGQEDKIGSSEPIGHTKRVTAIACFSGLVYSGSADTTIRVWDAHAARGWGGMTPIHMSFKAEEDAYLEVQKEEERLRREACEKVGEEFTPRPFRQVLPDIEKNRRRHAGLIMVMMGHTGAVTALAVNARVLVSGGADRQVLVWDVRDGRLLRRLRGHDLTISIIALDEVSFVTGSYDKLVRVWKISLSTDQNPAAIIDQGHRYAGHTATVTAVAIRNYEVVSGDAEGKIIVWDPTSGSALRVHSVHTKMVTCLGFDSTKVVSAGLDRRLIFTDIASGEPLIKNRDPHGESSVLALMFDASRMVTVGADHSIRHWSFRGGDPLPAIRTLSLRQGERLNVVARKYHVSLMQILRWSMLTDKNVYFKDLRVVVAPPKGSRGYDLVVAENAKGASDTAIESVGIALYEAEEDDRSERAGIAAELKQKTEEAFARSGVSDTMFASKPKKGDPPAAVITPPKIKPLSPTRGGGDDSTADRKLTLPPATPREKVMAKIAAKAGQRLGLSHVDMFDLADDAARSMGYTSIEIPSATTKTSLAAGGGIGAIRSVLSAAMSQRRPSERHDDDSNATLSASSASLKLNIKGANNNNGSGVGGGETLWVVA